MPPRWISLAAGLAVLTGIIGVVIGVSLAPDGDEPADEVAQVESGTDTGVSNVGEVINVADSLDTFDRPDDPARLGAVPGGADWEAAVGTWGVLAGQAYLVNSVAGRNLAVVDAGSANGTYQVAIPTVADGAGLVFRYRDPANYWAFVAVPGYATWAAIKVVDGQEESAANTGLSAVADGSTLGVRLDGDTIDLMVDSQVVTTITDGELSDATRVGLTSRNDGARLDDLRAEDGDAAGTETTGPDQVEEGGAETDDAPPSTEATEPPVVGPTVPTPDGSTPEPEALGPAGSIADEGALPARSGPG